MPREFIPYSDHRWDMIIPGLYVGGMWCQPGDGEPGTIGDVYVRDEFDRVYSMLYMPPRFGPSDRWRERVLPIEDAPLMPDLHQPLAQFSRAVATDVLAGRTVLVRCQMGLNRSALVAALAMVRMGIEPDDAITLLRDRRGPDALFNETFVMHIRRQTSREEVLG